MMYVFICPECGLVRMVSLLRELNCPVCGSDMANCELDYGDWSDLSKEKRKKIVRFYCAAKKEDLCFFRPMPYYNHSERNYW